MFAKTPPKKSLGQHFLMHRQIAERIVDAAHVVRDDTVLEIGPGTGMLTRELLKKAGRVVAIEADEELVPALESEFDTAIQQGELELIKGDVRHYDAAHISGPYKLVANIPYYITGEIIRQFLTTAHKPSILVLLVQKEVAERIARSKKESLLSLSVKAFGEPKYCFTVPKGAFNPAPKVDSAVLAIANVRTPFKNSAEEQRFFDILHAGFAHKRKMLAKNLEPLTDSAKIEIAFAKLGLSEKVRAEDVPLATWLTLATELG